MACGAGLPRVQRQGAKPIKNAFDQTIAGYDCPECLSTGDAGGLLRKFNYPLRDDEDGFRTNPQPVRVSYSRGLRVVTVPSLADAVEERDGPCSACGGNPKPLAVPIICLACRDTGVGRVTVPSEWLLCVVRAHPDLEAVVCLDVTVGHDVAAAEDPYCFYEQDLPAPFKHLAAPGVWFPTAEAAKLALARRIAQWAYEHDRH